METKFIGIDGFNEIETIGSVKKKPASAKKLSKTQKTVRFIKIASKLCRESAKEKSRSVKLSIENRAKKNNAKKSVRPKKRTAQKSVPDRMYIENRRTESGEFNASARESITKVVAKNNRRHAHSAPSNGYRFHALLKKKAILASVACIASITLSCMTVANALSTPEMSNNAKIAPIQSANGEANSVLFSATSDEIGNLTIHSNTVFGLYIDGELIGATNQTDELNAALDKVLVDYRKDYDDETTTEFANMVEVKSGSFEESEMMSVEDIMAKADGKFSISLSTDMYFTTELAYETEVEYDDDEYSSYEKVKTEGKNGEVKVTLRTTFVDGVQTDAVVTGSKTTKEPTNEVVVKGSKDGEYAVSSAGSGNGTSTGQFMWPLPYTHYVTSNFEWRWGRMHEGIDIADSGVYGQPIVAADGGTVEFAGNTGGGYGNYVIIDHGNGYKTIYGHASSLAVTTGQSVSQGETIAYVGSTGNSTGPHLHFEIVQNGTKINPLSMVS